MARWGYSPDPMVRKFWNEINGVAEGKKDPANKHGAQLVQAWAKGMKDMARMAAGNAAKVRAFGKRCFFAEFGPSTKPGALARA